MNDLHKMIEEITTEEAEYYADRIDESRSGRILIPTSIINKYRKTHDRPYASNGDVKAAILQSLNNKGLV